MLARSRGRRNTGRRLVEADDANGQGGHDARAIGLAFPPHERVVERLVLWVEPPCEAVRADTPESRWRRVGRLQGQRHHGPVGRGVVRQPGPVRPLPARGRAHRGDNNSRAWLRTRARERGKARRVAGGADLGERPEGEECVEEVEEKIFNYNKMVMKMERGLPSNKVTENLKDQVLEFKNLQPQAHDVQLSTENREVSLFYFSYYSLCLIVSLVS